MMSIEHFSGICWPTLILVTLFVEVAELEKFDGQRKESEKATIQCHILKKIAEEIENE